MRPAAAALTLSTAILVAASGISRADGDSGTLSFLEGGSLSSSVDVSIGFLYGAGARPHGLGIPVGTLHPGAASVAGNPAGLGFLASNDLLIDVLPPMGASVSDLADLESRAASALDDAITEVADPDLVPTYPVLEAYAGQQAGVVSGAMAVRLGPVVVGAAVEEPLSVSVDLVDTGIEAFAEGVKEDEGAETSIEMRCFADAAADLSFEIRRTTVAAGAAVGRRLAVGGSFSRYDASARLAGVLRADGIVNYGGQEYAFNDPSDPWHNDLGLTTVGDFAGDAYGWSAGATWRPLERLTIDVLYRRSPRLVLYGRLVTEENVIPAVSEDGIDLSEITASQPTLTEHTETVEDGDVILSLPSFFGVAASVGTGFATTTLEYRVFQGEIGFEHDGYTEAVELTDGLGAEMDFGGLRLGGGVIRGTLVGESAESGAGEDVLIPLANLGMTFELGEGLELGALFLALPLQVGRLSIGYEF